MLNIPEELKKNTPKAVILDTDAYNEIDDQYTIAYAMLSPDRVRLLAITAAPFFNSRSVSPADGMEKSYEEIKHIVGLVNPAADIPIYRGSEKYLPNAKEPVESDAARAIVRLVRESNETVYIVAIGAITNVASALLMAPDIAEKAVLVWLGGHALHFPHNREFNLYQDVPGAQVVFDSKIPLVQIPCNGVCTEFVTTIPEVEYYLKGKNPLCNYLVELTRAYNAKGVKAWSKIIWDVTAMAAIVRPDTLEMVEIPRPIITDHANYAFDMARDHYIYVRRIRRDPLYADLFTKLENC